jgi:hypothetical protein
LGVLLLELPHVVDGHLESTVKILRLLGRRRVGCRNGRPLQLFHPLGERVALRADGDQLGRVLIARLGANGKLLAQLAVFALELLQVGQGEIEFVL